MTKLETFKKYCEITKQQEKYGVVNKDNEGKLYVETFSKNTIKHIAYQHKEQPIYFDLIGEVVRICSATCGYTEKCKIGKPQKKCVDNGTYSLNKCAVVFLEKLDITKVIYQLSHSEFLALVNCI